MADYHLCQTSSLVKFSPNDFSVAASSVIYNCRHMYTIVNSIIRLIKLYLYKIGYINLLNCYSLITQVLFFYRTLHL